MADAFCGIHHDQKSAGRCGQCHRPYCHLCVRRSQAHGTAFCSDGCRIAYENFQATVKRKTTRGPHLRGMLHTFVVLAAVACGVYFFFASDEEKKEAWQQVLEVQKQTRSATDAAMQAATAIQQQAVTVTDEVVTAAAEEVRVALDAVKEQSPPPAAKPRLKNRGVDPVEEPADDF